MNVIAELIAAVAKGKGAKFASFTYKTVGTGEVAKHTLILGFSEEVMYEKDVVLLKAAIPELTGLHKVAAQELLDSREESLAKGLGNNSEYTCAGVYVHPENLGGIKVHIVDGTLHIHGLSEHKTVIVPGIYKAVNSSPKTIAKNEIRKTLPSSRFRQFKLNPANIKNARLNGETLEFDTEF